MSYLFNQPPEASRLGRQSRINLDRFFHIMNQGWFLYMRESNELVANSLTKDDCNAADKITGPFESKQLAEGYLNSFLEQSSQGLAAKQPEQPASKQPEKDSEDWRY